MKKDSYILVILFFGLIPSINFAQSAFPLAEGNTWYYEITYEFYNPPRPPSYEIFKVIGDTVMPNGKTFWIFNTWDMLWGKYIRSDSQYIYYWELNCNDGNGCEILAFNINATVGEDDSIN